MSSVATVLNVITHGLTPGDVLRIQADNMDPEIYRVSVNGVVLIDRRVAEEVSDPENDCLGFVQIPDVEALAA